MLPRTRVDCLDETTLTLFLDRRLPETDAMAAEVHIDVCDACRRLVSQLARTNTPAQPGYHVDRYILVRPLGSGGMGTVYVAYDPMLDRKVAVKLLRRETTTSHSRARLIREARALARVSSPNVVAVYDVGTIDDQVYITMELVRGGTLKTWLHEQPRSWREIVRVFEAAGRGVAAAHAEGIVHRDFKPDNVLIDGDRVCVADFGLAAPIADRVSHPALDPHADAAVVGNGGVTEPLTITGAVLGTPAYMAPEQLAGQAADERSDQFSFCVAVYEALYGARPFAGDNVEQLVREVRAGRVRATTRPTPRRLRDAVMRGLAVDPEARHPSMAALLAVLAHESPRRRTVALAAAGVAIAALAAGWAITQRTTSEAACPGPEQKLAGIWNAPRRDALQRALTTAGPFGAQVAQRTADALDAYAARWSTSWSGTCASSDHGEQSQAMFDLRVDCLSRRLRAFDSVVGVLTTDRVDIATRAQGIADELESIAPCDDPAGLLRVAPPSASAKPAVDALDAAIDKVYALRVQHRYPEALELATRTVAEARQVGYRPMTAQALHALGLVQENSGKLAEAEQSWQAASSDAIASNSDRTAANSLAALVDLLIERSKPAEAQRLADLAKAELERTDQPVALRMRLMIALSRLRLLEGKRTEALAILDDAIAVATKDGGSDSAAVAQPLGVKVQVLAELGRLDDALAAATRSVELRARDDGTAHPLYAFALGNRGNVYVELGQLDKAFADLRRAREILVAAFGPDTPQIGWIENNLSQIAGELGDWNEALRAGRAGLALLEKTRGRDDPQLAQPLDNIGSALRHLGKLDEADRELQRAEALAEPLGHDNPVVASALVELGELRLVQHRARDALELFERARDILVKASGKDHPEATAADSAIGRAQLAAGDARAAQTTLAATVAALERAHGDPGQLALTRLALADALWALGGRPAALAAVAKAEADLAPLPAGSIKLVHDDVATWKARHAPSPK
jgi:tetratricopeptide (TPR) repeat protein